MATAVALTVAAGIGVVYGAVPAMAATARLTIGTGSASCPLGYVCLWTLDNYTGSGFAFFNTEANYATLPAPFNTIENNSWSFYNNGQTSDITFYRDSGQTNDWFVVCKQSGIPLLPSNSTLPTASNEPGRGWRDAISSHRFGAYCS